MDRIRGHRGSSHQMMPPNPRADVSCVNYIVAFVCSEEG